ncbi:MAG: MoaD/ThiS family protein [Acidobacteria bacterium]|nr:MoaD/ThiS family protein [Acidobacteriota bacterium]
MIRVDLPSHLWRLAGLPSQVVQLEVQEPTLRGVLNALEAAYPMLRGTIRDQVTGVRRAFLRFFAEEQDISALGMDAPLPPSVATGHEPLLIIAAIAGG